MLLLHCCIVSNKYIVELDCAKYNKLTRNHCCAKGSIYEKHNVVI